jgi:hypothetical protein
MKGQWLMLLGLGLMLAAISFTTIHSTVAAWVIGLAGIVTSIFSVFKLWKNRRKHK